VVGKFLKDALYNNICPTLDLPDAELKQFSSDVLDRFRNPYLEHELMSISLNSISKFKTRVLPSVLEYIKRKNELPSNLLFSLASLIAFYKGDRNGTPIALKDDQDILDFFAEVWSTNNFVEVVDEVLSNKKFWGIDLTEIDGLQEEVTIHLESILNEGMKTALENFIK
jgi:tagaturonate reductase